MALPRLMCIRCMPLPCSFWLYELQFSSKPPRKIMSGITDLKPFHTLSRNRNPFFAISYGRNERRALNSLHLSIGRPLDQGIHSPIRRYYVFCTTVHYSFSPSNVKVEWCGNLSTLSAPRICYDFITT